MMVALEGAGSALKGGTKHPLLLVVHVIHYLFHVFALKVSVIFCLLCDCWEKLPSLSPKWFVLKC